MWEESKVVVEQLQPEQLQPKTPQKGK
jgi:hypothetical protein